ncbi:MAG TPA: serine hydrolase domain-containing protein [Actinomycetota bacterium]|nr:serine hydrolase domain-containing protein [Actinomycetota bacterium]
MPDESSLRERLSELIAEHEVPGAAIGVLHRGQLTQAAAGVVNRNTGVEATTDTVFQIGSMTKSWTATVVMMLADEGLVSLDEPVKTYLPDFRVADPDVTEKVTLRHLLAHTSGIDGDHFPDCGRGDDCLERYVQTCADLKQTHPFGATMSYCNTGYSVAGRVIEVVTGSVWDQVMRERLYVPLGLTQTGTLPEEALLHLTAVGHVRPKPSQPPQVAPVWMLPRGCGPMGLVNSTVRDALEFARLHLDGGRGLLSEASVRTMQEPQVEVPDPYTLGSHWGVGWILFDWDGRRLYGHDGNTIGQAAFLRVLPDEQLAVCLLTNGGDAAAVYRKLYSEILTELAGVRVPPYPVRPETPLGLDLSRYEGSFERLSVRVDLEAGDGGLDATITLSGPIAAMVPEPVSRAKLTPVDETTFLISREGAADATPVVFYGFEEGTPRYLHMGARAHPRV